jgi:anti-sigma factor RsiW
MSDIHALSGAYAVDALDDIERAKFERHLADCPACTSEVDSLREAAALLAETTTTAPSTELRARVLAQIASVRPLPPLVGPQSPAADGATVTEIEPRRRRRVLPFLAAAAAAIAIGTGGIVWQQVTDDSSQSQLSASDRILQAEDAETFTNTFPGGAEVKVVRSKALNEALVMTDGLDAAPNGHMYALWLQHDNVMVPAGTMPADSSTVIMSGDAATASGAGITVEDATVEPTSPSDDVVALFDFQQQA